VPKQSRSESPNGPLGDKVGFPTVEEWLDSLPDILGHFVLDWDSVRDKFRAQDYLDVTIDKLSRTDRTEIRVGFGLNMKETGVIIDGLEATIKELGFKVEGQGHHAGKLKKWSRHH